MIKKQLSLLLFFVLFYSWQLVGQKLITGFVFDTKNQEALIGASVYAPNEKIGTTSNFKGEFEITTTDSILIFSYAGYNPREIRIDSLPLQVGLTAGVLLPETIIYGRGTNSRPSYQLHPAVSYLYKEDLQINNESIIEPTLNLVPGVLMHSGALNTNRITIRGIGNRNLFGTAKIKAFLDGIPLTNGSGETTLEDIDLSIVDAVTVYKGPSSSIFGAGLGGMISLKTPDNIYRTGNTLSIKSTGGSFGLARNNLTFSRSNFDRSLVTINLNQTHSDGYRENNEYNRLGFAGFGKFKMSETEEINVLVNYTFLKARIPSSLDSTDFADNPEKAAFIWQRARGYEQTERSLIGASYSAFIGKHFRQISSIFGSFRDTDEFRPFNILRESAAIKGGRTEWIYSFERSQEKMKRFEFHLGGELFDEDYDWQTYDTDGEGSREQLISDNKERRYYVNLFAQLQMDFENIAITSGINRNYTYYSYIDYYRINGNQSGKRRFPRVWSPFFNVGFDLAALFDLPHNLALSTTLSHGFSPPTLEETLTPEGQINPSIIPERGWNFEVGLQGDFSQKFYYDLSFYNMKIKDLLVARRNNFDQFVGLNAGGTIHRGIEAAMEYRVNLERSQIRPFLNYTYSDYFFDDFVDGDQDYSGNELTGTPPHHLTIGIIGESKKFYGNLMYRFVDAMPLRDDNSIYSESYQLVNFKLGYKKEFIKNWQLDFFGGINNIFDTKYASMFLINAGSFGGNAPRYYYPGLPRNFYLGVEIKLGEN